MHLLAAVVAQSIAPRGDGKFDIVGAYEEIHVSSLPAMVERAWYVALSVTPYDLTHDVKVEVIIEGPDGKAFSTTALEKKWSSQELGAARKPSLLQLAAKGRLNLTMSGKFKMRVRHGLVDLVEVPFWVVEDNPSAA